MVGGDAAALERARPVLDALAAKIVHVGALGTGATMKLAVNALIHGIDVGLSEALVLAEKAGVERSAAYEVFAVGRGRGAVRAVQARRLRAPRRDPAGVQPRPDGEGPRPDPRARRRGGAPMDQAAQNRARCGDALDAGFGGHDLSAVAPYLRGVSGPTA